MGSQKPSSKPDRFPRSAGAGIGIFPPSSLLLVVTVPKITTLDDYTPQDLPFQTGLDDLLRFSKSN